MTKELFPWTVLLLRPDAITDNFGQDTYLAHVDASTADEALSRARAEAAAYDQATDTGEEEDYFCLFCALGHVKDLSDGCGNTGEPAEEDKNKFRGAAEGGAKP